jgi:hypothetical protein
MAELVARAVEMRISYKSSALKVKRREHSGYLGVNKSIILKWILKNYEIVEDIQVTWVRLK